MKALNVFWGALSLAVRRAPPFHRSHKFRLNSAHLFVGTCLSWVLWVGAQEAENQRMQRLEEAVQQLQKQNETLRRQVQGLEQQKTAAGAMQKPILEEAPKKDAKSPFVLPLGKESKIALGGFVLANGEFGDVSSFEGRLAGGPNAIRDRIRIRNARLEVAGEFLEQFDFKVGGTFHQGDGLSGNRTAFSGADIFINWRQLPEANFKVGQFKAPFGLEQLTPITKLFTAERSLVTGALTPQRQVGAQIWGQPFANIGPFKKDFLDYAVGVFNGNGRNISVNDNSSLMSVGRLGLAPYSGKIFGQDAQLRWGANALHSRDASNTDLSPAGNLFFNPDGSLTPFTTHSPDERWGWGADQSLSVGPFDLIAEYLQESVRPTVSNPNFAQFTARGYYVQASCFLFAKRLQLVAKWESFSSGQRAADGIDSATGGLNYYVHGDNIKVMLDYIHTWAEFRESNPQFGKDEFDQVLLRLQLMF